MDLCAAQRQSDAAQKRIMNYTSITHSYKKYAKPSDDRLLSLANRPFPELNISPELLRIMPNIERAYIMREAKYRKYRAEFDENKPSRERYEGYKMRYHILNRDGFKCQNPNCENPANRGSEKYNSHLHVHHIVPLSEGGRSVPDNMMTLCAECHMNLEPELWVEIEKKSEMGSTEIKQRNLDEYNAFVKDNFQGNK